MCDSIFNNEPVQENVNRSDDLFDTVDIDLATMEFPIFCHVNHLGETKNMIKIRPAVNKANDTLMYWFQWRALFFALIAKKNGNVGFGILCNSYGCPFTLVYINIWCLSMRLRQHVFCHMLLFINCHKYTTNSNGFVEIDKNARARYFLFISFLNVRVNWYLNMYQIFLF